MTPGVCHSCQAPIVLHRLPLTKAPAWRAPVLAFGSIEQDVWVEPAFRPEALADGPQENGLVLGLLPLGEPVACRPLSVGGVEQPSRTASEWRGRALLAHGLSCPAQRDRQLPPPGDPGACRGCGQAVLWIQTPLGKKAPLDPEPHRGVRLSKAEARAAVHTRGYVVGLTRHGEQVAIREGGQMTLGAELAENATVYVNHFATCPRRADFTQPRGGPRG